MILLGSCLSISVSAQTTPLATPQKTEYPGILQTFENLIQVDNTKFKNKITALTTANRGGVDLTGVTDLELDPDFLNSVILHSDSGYIKLASTSKCRFYDTILTDLLKDAEGKIKHVLVTYKGKEGKREEAVILKKDFLNRVVTVECPETQKLIDQFQVKNLDKTLNSTLFEIPSGPDQCRNIHVDWLNNPKTPYLCQIHEYIKEARAGQGDPKDLPQRQAMMRLLEKKLSLVQRDYIGTLCTHLEREELFCDRFLSVSFWNKVAAGLEDKVYVADYCRVAGGELTDGQVKNCLPRLQKEVDLCHYGDGKNQGLTPHMDCDGVSLALNHSHLRANYQDCPGNSDQLGATNFARIFLNITGESVKPTQGVCSVVSAAETLNFNEKFDNDEAWNLEACYQDQARGREICTKTFFGEYGKHPLSYTNVVAGILKETRGADPATTCKMVDAATYNPLLLEFKSGCFILFERDKCFISQCKHRVLFNDRNIDLITIKSGPGYEYFPLTVRGERTSLQYLLTRDYKRTGRSLNNLSDLTTFFKKSKKGIIHGIGCAEDLLPSFFRTRAVNQCTALPFILDGVIKNENQVAFVGRSAADTLQAPRIMSWSNIFSAVKAYQGQHPLKIWTLYGLD